MVGYRKRVGVMTPQEEKIANCTSLCTYRYGNVYNICGGVIFMFGAQWHETMPMMKLPEQVYKLEGKVY